MRTLVQDFLQHSTSAHPNKVALICNQKQYRYHEINSMANRLANTLINNGTARGDRIVILLQNSVEAVVSIFAVLKAGAVFVVVNPTTKANKFSFILKNCGATALITDSKKASILQSVINNLPSLKYCVICGNQSINKTINFHSYHAYDDIQRKSPNLNPPNTNIDLDLACLIYTSGSTGYPKAVMSDHSSVDFATSSIIEYLENDKEDIILNGLPLSFDYGLYQLLMVIKFGGTLVLERTFLFPNNILQLIQDHRVTGFPGVPSILAILSKMDLSRYDLTSLRYITNTAADLSPNQIFKLKEKFPETLIYSMYGLTETKRTLYMPPEELMSRPKSVGKAIPGTEVWIEDESGKRVQPGNIGELVVRGRHVMRGYWDNPEATAETFRPGNYFGERICYTGDLFYEDDEGYFYFVSRKDDVFKSRGQKVSPIEVERVLCSIEGVIEAAVIGHPDPIIGQAIKAFLVVDNVSITETQVLSYCRGNLDDCLVPQYLEFCEQLPKTSSGKINKTELR